MFFSRLHRRRSFRSFTKFYPIIVIGVLLWGEWLNYRYWRLSWNIARPKAAESLGILIVADPQLVGFKNEDHMWGPVTRWDSDRYLSKGFSHALAATKPDLIIFLGDLFDEGVEASETEIDWTTTRFFNIFDTNIPKIYISGDNDVGGEGDPVQSHLTTRFKRIFNSTFPHGHPLFDRLTISEVNLMNGEVVDHLFASSTPKLSVILSHVAFSTFSYHESNSFLKSIEPDLILSAHDHRAYIHRIPRAVHHSGGQVSSELTGSRKIESFSIGEIEPVLELQSPTCSYRMGVLDVGYGFARLEYLPEEKKFTASYSVLWLASRFYTLTLYAITGVPIMYSSYIIMPSAAYPRSYVM
ncbi:unnamed protein product [Cylicocyclus nassatus]|uniref:Calcineurin-like phosphoesterase domain-containing protein n=1 Tax=Cylicocyclus nassatus TaxID=53992 RepID=A0AA36MAL3_CYLNA|nr:unnamed protein product [Cylicocyclus nassatus]